MRIGIDVGGTNTDAVIMDGHTVVAGGKTPTTPDVSTGVETILKRVMAEGRLDPKDVQAVMIGTTHFTNAVVERRRLLPVAAIRIGLPAASGLPPLCDWPDDLRKIVGGDIYMVRGGYDYDGRPIAGLDESALVEAARAIKIRGLRSAAISCIFSPVNSDMEKRAAEILRNEVPDIAVTLSSNIGRIGLMERESAAIMNACLTDLATHVIESFQHAFEALGIHAPFYISQNDGTLMAADFVERYPVLTFASGPTNSMRGALFLAGVQDAMVVDIGGTTSDVGMLVQGFPREASVASDIGGVRTNFRMPDVLPIGLGGGSIVRDNGLRIGPDSVGYQLTEKALVFGGDTLTTTDIVVAAGLEDIGDRSKVAHLKPELIENALTTIHEMLDTAVDRMKTSPDPLPLIMVGGGAILQSWDLPSASEVIRPENASVANAIGAAIAQVGGDVDRLYSLDNMSREEALADAKAQAALKAVAAGADPDTLEVLDVEEIMLSYLPGNATRLRVKMVGDLAHK